MPTRLRGYCRFRPLSRGQEKAVPVISSRVGEKVQSDEFNAEKFRLQPLIQSEQTMTISRKPWPQAGFGSYQES